MTKYLSFNGTSDYLQLPSLTIKKITIDGVFPLQTQDLRMILDAQTGLVNGYVYARTSQTLTNAGGVFIETNFQWNTRTTTDFTATKNLDTNGNFTDDVTIFSDKSFGENFKGSIYDIKCYNASNALVAHYDMSTGTVIDQSGNGNNATLNGGTWLDDGAGATGTPVTYTYDTKQTIYANKTLNLDTKQTIYKNINLNADTKQSVYANRLTNYDTKQIQYKNIQTSYDSKQMIYKAIQELFDTEQVFTQGFTQVSYNYDVKIEQYKPIQEGLDTKQAIYKDISLDLDTKQIVYKTIQTLYDTLIQLRNEHDETLYATLTIQRVIEHHLRINQGHEDTLKIQRTIEHILRI